MLEVKSTHQNPVSHEPLIRNMIENSIFDLDCQVEFVKDVISMSNVEDKNIPYLHQMIKDRQKHIRLESAQQ